MNPSLLYRALTVTLARSSDLARVDRSRLIWGSEDGYHYRLTPLSVINSFLPDDVRLVRIDQVDENE